MKNLFILITLTILPAFLLAQKDSTKVKRIGIIGTADITYNFQDKVLSPGLARKWTIGMSFTNKQKQFIAYISAGIKGAKINLYSPVFRESFINDVRNNYVPINGTSEDSLIGAKMYQKPGSSLWGTYAQFLQVGFVLNRKMKPSFSFFVGSEEFLLHDDGFRFYEDPKYGDINYVGMRSTFYELKVGCGLPLKKTAIAPGTLNLNIGYKWVNYGAMAFNNTPISDYTKGDLAKKYHETGKLIASLSFMFWSNWE